MLRYTYCAVYGSIHLCLVVVWSNHDIEINMDIYSGLFITFHMKEQVQVQFLLNK